MIVGKEKPRFFKSNHEYYKVNVDTDRFKNLNSNEVDNQDSRDSERSIKDANIGKIAENVMFIFLEERGNDVEFAETWEYDLLVNGYKMEVKARDYTQTDPKYKDLLVRDRKDNYWSPSDVDYISQVMLNGTDTEYAYITGYIEGKKAENADIFHKAKTHRTRKVNHNQLVNFINTEEF